MDLTKTTFEELLTRANMDSPKKTFPIAIPYIPAISASPSHA